MSERIFPTIAFVSRTGFGASDYAHEKPPLRLFFLIHLALPLTQSLLAAGSPSPSGSADREYSVAVLTRIAEPVLSALSKGELKKQMPVHAWERERVNFTRLEAFCRTLAGIAPWLALEPDATDEGKLREKFLGLAVKSIAMATDPASPDFMNYTQGAQPIVDVAFLAEGLLRAPKLWDALTETERAHLVAALKSARVNKAGENNWLLFTAIVEAALWSFTGECEVSRIEYAVNRHMEWYKGDGAYGDGDEFHWDYYNSYVIHPMLLEVLRVCTEKKHALGSLYPKELARARRYAVVQERMISPEGTFPVIGRSSCYRFGAFHLLAKISLLRELPDELRPGAVRSALTTVIRRMIEAPGTFDEKGWLQLGVVGSQPSIHESYNSTGALYLCTVGLLHLGLPANDPLWTEPAAPWTQKRIWAGEDMPADHAHKETK